MSQENILTSVLDQAIEFMELALQEKQADNQRLAELAESLKKAKLEQDKVILEKVAAAKAEVFDYDNVLLPVLTKMVGMGIITNDGATKVANRVKADPNALATFMLKVAERLMSASDEGHGVDKDTAIGGKDEDPDGWVAFAKGEKVKVRR